MSTSMAKRFKTEFFLCECVFPEHLFYFSYDQEDNVLYRSAHLSTKQGFFRRIWIAVKYILGHQSTYGDFDEVIIQPADRNRLISVINQLKVSNE